MYIASARSSKRTHIYGLVGRVYEIKTLRSNLAPEEEGGRLFDGGELSSKYGKCFMLL